VSRESFYAYYDKSKDKNPKEREFCEGLIDRFLEYALCIQSSEYSQKTYYGYEQSMVKFIQGIMHERIDMEDVEL